MLRAAATMSGSPDNPDLQTAISCQRDLSCVHKLDDRQLIGHFRVRRPSGHNKRADVALRVGNDRCVKRTSSFITTFRMQILPNAEFGAALLTAKVSRKALSENCLIVGHLR